MSRDTTLKILILAVTAVVGGVLLAVQGMRCSLWDGMAAAGVVGVLGPAAVVCHQRRTPQFVMTLMGVMTLMVYTSCFTVLMYGAAALGFPLIDGSLRGFDAALGVDVPAIVAWAKARPAVALVIECAYNTTIIQTFLAVIVLGFAGRRRELEGFVLHFMLALSVTAAIFCFLPAEGPFATYGYEPTEIQARYLDHLHTLRSGERTTVVLKEAEGLVTFPSFHTAWAIILAFAFRRCRWWFPVMLVVNALVVVGTLTTGWHYFTDVLGGVIVAVAVIWFVHWLQRWIYARSDADGSDDRCI